MNQMKARSRMMLLTILDYQIQKVPKQRKKSLTGTTVEPELRCLI